MAEQEAKDNATRKRIVDHMNANHHDSLVRYLEHYCKLPTWKAHDGKMTDIDLTGMTFTCHEKTYRIPLEPPMGSYREVRERAAAMDAGSLAGLNRSDITIDEVVPPHGFYILGFLITATTFVAYSQRWWFGPGHVVEQWLGPGFARFCWAIQPWLISAMLAIHGAEAVLLKNKYLRRHSVNPRSRVWWLWMFFGFVEGQFAFWRFHDLVRRKRAEKEKRKH